MTPRHRGTEERLSGSCPRLKEYLGGPVLGGCRKLVRFRRSGRLSAAGHRYKKQWRVALCERYTCDVLYETLRNWLALVDRWRFRHFESEPHSRRPWRIALRSLGLSTAGPSAGSASRLLDRGGHPPLGDGAAPPDPQAAPTLWVDIGHSRSGWPSGFYCSRFSQMAEYSTGGFLPLLFPADRVHDRHEPRCPAGSGNRGRGRVLDRGQTPE